MRRNINLEKYWDREKICRNPHKGWYLHYFDNGITKYGDRLAPNDFLEDFPGLDHIYLRLDWAHLEPEEGKFRWEIIDRVIEQWLEHGYTISFRIACKETSRELPFATPEWVRNAGAEGSFVGCAWDPAVRAWEPDYGDPVFLEKLENFHRAFAERYDGKPWVEYIDIGSYGDWGEGHTASSSLRDWPAEVIKKHIDLHCRCYKESLLVISDDIVGSREVEDGSGEEILAYLVEQGITLRDDGVCVKWFANRFGFSTLRNPEMFDLFWQKKPINLELEHYDATVRQDTWKKGLPFIVAVEESHATFVGFHGYAREWLKDNEDVARVLANRVGYWYFLKAVELPDRICAGTKLKVKTVWENHGVAPAYHPYSLYLVLENTVQETQFEKKLDEADNTRWMPGRIMGETSCVLLPDNLPRGNYKVKLALMDESQTKKRPIELAMVNSIRDSEGYYHVADMEIE